MMAVGGGAWTCTSSPTTASASARSTSCPSSSPDGTGSCGWTSRSGRPRPPTCSPPRSGCTRWPCTTARSATGCPSCTRTRSSLFLVLHAPERGAGGHVHHVELDRLIGPRYLVTVHGPVNPAVPIEVALRDTRDVLERIRAGRLRPRTSFDISHAIVSTLTRRMERFVEDLTSDVWELERRVTDGAYGNPEHFLDEMFRTRHGLLAVKTIAAQTAEIYRRLAGLPRAVPDESRHLVTDLIDQFDRIAGLAGEEKDYLQGVIEFYRTRTETKMTIAAERLAVIAVVTLPITALASVLGMNLIVNDRTTRDPARCRTRRHARDVAGACCGGPSARAGGEPGGHLPDMSPTPGRSTVPGAPQPGAEPTAREDFDMGSTILQRGRVRAGVAGHSRGPRRGARLARDGRRRPRRTATASERLPAHRHGHHGPARQRPELGLLQERRVRRQRPQRRGPGQDLDAREPGAGRPRATATRCSSTRATPSRAPRWRTTTPRSSRSRSASSTRWPPR